MAIMSSNGVPVYTQNFTNGRLVSSSSVSMGLSHRIDYSDPVSVKRKKPAPIDLIWYGTSYSKSRTEYKFVACVYKYATYGDGTYRNYQIRHVSSNDFFGFSVPVLPSEPVDPMNKLINKFRSDVANIATMLGEYKESTHLFEGTAKAILTSVALARRGKIGEALVSLGKLVPHRKIRKKQANGRYITEVSIDVPAAWLLYKLALSPLIGDIDLLVKELTDKLDELPPAPVVKQTASARTFKHDRKTISADRYVTWSGDIKRRLVAYVVIDNHQLKSMSDHGLTSPLGLMWELTWLSFVVDYVFNVSEWLQALDMPMNFSRSVCYETRTVRMNGSFSASGYLGIGSAAYPAVAQSPITASCKHMVSSRSIRALTAVSPQWNPRGSTSRLATLSSLAVVLGRKLKS